VLAAGLAFVMLGLGGLGGIVNMSYGMNAMVHNTSWVTAHFHLIFGGSVVIMYFAIAYEIWPTLTGRRLLGAASMRAQLWLWFIGTMVMTLPWHAVGLSGQPRRVGTFDYSFPETAWWGPWTLVSTAGGAIMLASALLFVWNLATLHRDRGTTRADGLMAYALAVHPPQRLPAALNGFAMWNWLVLILMLIAYGYPIAQFFINDSPPAMIHRA
jgi:cytochrome c oxidase subunit I